MNRRTPHFYEFGPFRLDSAEQLLLRDGQPVPLTLKSLELLLVLVENSGHIVSKNDLMKAVWPDTFVEETNLTRNVFTLRQALGENTNGDKYIETIPKRGYRFVADVKEVADESAEPILQEQAKPQSTAGVKELADQGGAAAPAHVTSPVSHLVSSIKRREIAVSIFALALLALVGTELYLRFWPEVAVESLAVLPFSNGSADPQSEYLSDGITESLINNLSQLPGLQVKARTTVFRYKGQEINLQQVGRTLGVQTVLTGKVVQRADALIIQADLVRVADGSQVWGAQYNRKPADIFAVQEEIAREIVGKLRLRLSNAEQQQLTKRYTGSTEAYHCYLKGRHILDKRTPKTTEKSIEYFEQAVKIDPAYALAYAYLAYAYSSLNYLGARPPKEVVPKVREAVTRALEIDNTLAEAHVQLAALRHYFDWDWSGAGRAYRRALELNPNSAHARWSYAFYLLHTKRYDEALAEMKRVLELEPVSVVFNRDVAQILYYSRRYDEAIEQCYKTLELDPNMPTVYGWLGRAYGHKGLYEQAVTAHLNGRNHSGFSPETIAALREAYAISGWKGFWQKMLAVEKERATQRYRSPHWFAAIYARLGEKEQALHWLEKAYEDGNSEMASLNVDPVWDDLRSDPRFADLLRRVGFAE